MQALQIESLGNHMGTRKVELPSSANLPNQLIRTRHDAGASAKTGLAIGAAARGIYTWVTQSATDRGGPARRQPASGRAEGDEVARRRRAADRSDHDSAWSPTIPSVMDM